ncbi:MAG TPA: hypothetical protein VMX38_12140 [Verrucomicrobiae bacterium]|jgi:hypothetical protein|nr:hypothetical protein [Verrucomicrobiae bacterium]
MRAASPYVLPSLLVLIAVLTLACGSPSMGRGLQSVTISPTSAEGQMQFTATGFFNVPPSPVTPLTVTWGACYQNESTTEVSVSKTGFAQCGPGASGTYTVWGYGMSGAQACPAYVTACGGGGCQVTGTAQLTCP